MKKATLLTLFLAFTLSLFAQRNSNREYWNTWQYKPNKGMTQKFEAAAAAKTKKFNASPENLIVTYKISTGDNAGTYERIMPYQTPASYDKDKTAELDHWKANVGKYCTPVGGQQIWERMSYADVNIKEGANPSKYLMKTIYVVKPGHNGHFGRFIQRLGKVQGDRSPDVSSITLRLQSGGNRNMYVRYVGFNKHEQAPKEDDLSWEDVYNEMFGWNTWETDLELYNNSLEIWGRQSEKLRLVEALLPTP